MRLKNTFIQSKMNKDIDERLLPKGQYPHAENIRVANTDASDMGSIENVRGNTALTTFNLTNAFTIGSFEDGANEKLYFFTTSDEKDIVVEYNTSTNTSAVLLDSSNPNSVLNFSRNNLITGVEKIINGDVTQDLLAWTDNRNPPRIINIERAKTFAANGFVEDDISLIKKPPREAPSTTLTFTDTALESNLRDRFVAYAYRYRYLDGEYSALSPFSNYQFSPNSFRLDFQTLENTGMENAFNAVRIDINTGSERVTDVQIVFKETNSNAVNVIETFNKADQGWGNNQTQSFVFSNDKIYRILESSQLTRYFDNVPLKAQAMEFVGNRLVFGNYTEGYDLIDVNNNNIAINYELALSSTSIAGISLPVDFSTAIIGIDLTGIELKEGSKISLDINMLSVASNVFEGGAASFSGTFNYVLTSDANSALDLSINPDFLFFLENVMTNRFLNGIVGTLLDNVTFRGNTNFGVQSVTGNEINLGTPTVVYDRDNTPNNPNDNDVTIVVAVWNYQSPITAEFSEIATPSSLKSNRSYEIGMIYMDEYGRASTVITDKDNTIYIEPSKSVSQNKIVVTVRHNPPVWADRYKFVIKQNKDQYQIIYTTIFYRDGLFRWILLDGANKDKVSEGDTLIVKSDLSGFLDRLVTTRVIEVREQSRDFLENNTDANGQNIIEPPGLYMKIKPTGFDLTANSDRFLSYERSLTSNRGRTPQIAMGLSANLASILVNPDGIPIDEVGTLVGYFDTTTNLYVDIPITEGSTIDVRIENRGEGRVNVYERVIVAQSDYTNFQQFWEAQVPNLGAQEPNFNITFERRSDFANAIWMLWVGNLRNSILNGTINVALSSNIAIFETTPNDTELDIYYETGQTFDIINNRHQGNDQNQSSVAPAIVTLDAFNCYVQGNGAESYRIRDAFNSRFLNIDLRPTTISEEEYRQVIRYADLTYSGIYNENTNVNRLNEFNLSLANFKEDLNKGEGSIQKLFSRDTNLIIFQEDKVSYVLVNKDQLLNADGTSNITATANVLGQQIPYAGEYGISLNPESFVFDGFYIYFTDAKRGAVMRLSREGLVEISRYGMEIWFKDRFLESLNGYKLGGYDPFHDQYVLTLEDQNYTITFDESINGWTSFHSFIPDYTMGMNNELYSFKGGDLFLHNSPTAIRNTYYGGLFIFPSKISMMVNDGPSDIKQIHAVSLEGNKPWDVSARAYVSDTSDFISTTIKDTEFVQKEGYWYAYMRRNEDENQLDSKAAYGIGEIASVDTANNTITINYVNSLLSEGDIIATSPTNDVGTITNVAVANGNTTLTISSMAGLNPVELEGTFIFGKKPARIEGGGLRGYTIRLDLELATSDRLELFAVNSEVTKSFS